MTPSPPRPATERRAVLVVNDRSRSGRDVLTEASRLLREGGLDLVAVHREADPARLPLIVADAVASGAELVVLGGGDGTVSSCVGSLAGRDVVLGLLPTGTANDFARTLGIPSDLVGACDVVLSGCLVDVDLGTVGGGGPDDGCPDGGRSVGGIRRHLVNVASIGLSVEVTRALSPRLKRRLGAFAYPVATVRAYRGSSSFRARLEFPDADHEQVELDDLLQVAVANGRHYGGGSVVAPAASIDDHTLDVYAIPRGTARQRLTVARHFASGAFVEQDHVLHVRTRRVRVITDPPRPVNIDGEIVTHTPLLFGVERNALLVTVPQDSDAARLDASPS